MEWIVSLEAGGDAGALRARLASLQAALGATGAAASADEGDHGLGTTLVVESDDVEGALRRALDALRVAEQAAGLAPLPFLTAEVVSVTDAERPTPPPAPPAQLPAPHRAAARSS